MASANKSSVGLIAVKN